MAFHWRPPFGLGVLVQCAQPSHVGVPAIRLTFDQRTFRTGTGQRSGTAQASSPSSRGQRRPLAYSKFLGEENHFKKLSFNLGGNDLASKVKVGMTIAEWN